MKNEKTPRELLTETLLKNREEFLKLPKWIRTSHSIPLFCFPLINDRK